MHRKLTLGDNGLVAKGGRESFLAGLSIASNLSNIPALPTVWKMKDC